MSKRQCKSKIGTVLIWGLIYEVAVKILIKTLKTRGFYEGVVSAAGGASGGYFIQLGASARKRMRMGTEYDAPQSINFAKNGNPFDSSISQMLL
jgi:hypothetical protein